MSYTNKNKRHNTDFANVIGSSCSYSGVPGEGGRTLAVELARNVSLCTIRHNNITYRLVGEEAARTFALLSSSSISLYKDNVSV
jgi:hypothetical protein